MFSDRRQRQRICSDHKASAGHRHKDRRELLLDWSGVQDSILNPLRARKRDHLDR